MQRGFNRVQRERLPIFGYFLLSQRKRAGTPCTRWRVSRPGNTTQRTETHHDGSLCGKRMGRSRFGSCRAEPIALSPRYKGSVYFKRAEINWHFNTTHLPPCPQKQVRGFKPQPPMAETTRLHASCFSARTLSSSVTPWVFEYVILHLTNAFPAPPAPTTNPASCSV